MYCKNCGKEISDQAKFCNYCGTQMSMTVSKVEYQPEPQPTAVPKKKGRTGKRILILLMAVVIYIMVRYVAESALTAKPKEVKQKSESGTILDLSQPSLADACIYGGLYEDGYLRYGMTKLYVPGYELLPGEAGEGDYLMNEDGNCMLTVNKQTELVPISFDATNRESLLQSIRNMDSNAEIVSYKQLELNGYPVIRCIARCTIEGMDQYIGELIVFPEEVAKETIRLNMYELAEYGFDEIEEVFESLNIYPQFAPKAEDTNVIGLSRITVKGGDTSAKQEATVNTVNSATEEVNTGSLWSEAEIQAAMDSCDNGAVYENGTLRYGLAKLDLPGYKLDRTLEEIDVDRLYTADGTLHISARQHLLAPPFEECTAKDLSDLLWYPAESIDFEKYYVNGFPVIRCYYYDESYSFFIGHLIIYPYKTSDTVLGFSMTADAAAGYYYTDIYDVFDTLQVSPEYKVTETNYSGSADRRITVK